jgi:hypothetical protein
LIHALEGDGDFRSDECIELLKEADVVVANPPFSLFREYVTQLVAMKKKFLVIANHNAITYKEIFRLIQQNEVWLGYTHPVNFMVPDHYKLKRDKELARRARKELAQPWKRVLVYKPRHRQAPRRTDPLQALRRKAIPDIRQLRCNRSV